MVNVLRPVTPDFLEHAPVRLVSTARLRAEPEAVFQELTEDASTWPQWFREIRSARYTGPPPHGVGAGRAVALRGGVRLVESVLVCDPPRRFVYRVEQVNVPSVRAWAEEWLLSPAPDGGTALRFTIAVETPLSVGLLLTAIRPGVSRSVRIAARRLDARCGNGVSSGVGGSGVGGSGVGGS
ncbi:SRPBCC family protein [Streptacidiphilus sp. EB129]|uniref:SRPBCC family protein n=1 Tax=Streptacidiphilus sp. EB129 TaxID=3156262 RepID=UPI0035163161